MSVNNNPPIQIAPGTEESQKDAFINENFRKLSDSLNPFQISDGTNNILNIGKDSTGEYTVKVSKPGFDAFDAAPENLIFNSNQNVFKIAATGTVAIPSVAAPGNPPYFVTGVTTVDTGIQSTTALAYSAYLVTGSSSTQLPYAFTVANVVNLYSSVAQYFSADTFISGGTVRFRVTVNNYDSVPTTATTVKYYIFQETAA